MKMIRKVSSFLLLVFVALQLTGCAAGWFAGGAATGAVAEHQYDIHNKK